MNTKAITATIVLAAVTVVLNPALSGIGVPAPYAPFLIYQLWEIPIVVAFLLLGPRYGVSISILNAFVLLAIFPGALLLGPFYNLVAVLSMLLGVYLVHKFINRKDSGVTSGNTGGKKETLIMGVSTALGMLLRVGVMTVVNYAALRYSPPIGYGLTELAIVAAIPLIGLFNATLALYTVPLGHIITSAIRSNLRLSR